MNLRINFEQTLYLIEFSKEFVVKDGEEFVRIPPKNYNHS